MKSEFKKISVSIMILLCVIILTGCNFGKKQDKNNNDNNNQNNIESVAQNGYFAEYKGDLYYWSLSEKSRADSAIFSDYEINDSTKNVLLKKSSDGKEKVLLTETGFSQIFIVNNKLFTTVLWKDGSVTKELIVSMNLDGQEFNQYKNGSIKSVIGDYLICENNADGKSEIFRINSKNNEIETIKKGASYLCNSGDHILYQEDDENGTIEKISIGTITQNKDNGTAVKYTSKEVFNEEFSGQDMPIEVFDAYVKNNKFLVSLVYRAGTAHVIQEVVELTVDLDGKNPVLNKNVSDDNNENLTYSEELTSKDKVYIAHDQKNNVNNLYYYNKETNERNKIMSVKELEEKLYFESGEEYKTTVVASNIIGNNAYVIVDNSVHDSKNDIGWRYAYKRLKTTYIKIDLNTKKIETL